MSNPLFRSSDGYFSVHPCRCGCDGLVKVTGIMEHECGKSQYYYVRGHQAVGTTYEHIGQRYEFVPEALKSVGSPSETFSQVPATLPLSQPENAADEPADALDDAYEDCPLPSFDWDDEKTPTVQLSWNEWPEDDA